MIAGTGIAVVGTGVAGNCYEVSLEGGAVFVADTDCIDLEGDGSIGDPITAEPIIPATVDHPLIGPGLPVINGLSCEAAGLGTGPYGFVLGGGGALPIGSLPAIVANTAGFDPWGPALSVSFPNPSPFGQIFGGEVFTTHPLVAVVLEPGASFEYGFSTGCPDPIGAPFLTFVTNSRTNASGVTEVFTFQPTLAVNGFALGPAGVLDVCVVSRARLAGSTGASSITSAIFGSGIDLNIFGGTI